MLAVKLVSFIGLAAAQMPSLPQAPGYLFADCNGPNGIFTQEVWSVQDMSQACVAGVGRCGIISKAQYTVPPFTPGGTAHADFTVDGVNGVANPFVFGTWAVHLGENVATGVGYFKDGTITDSRDNLQWDAYSLMEGNQVPQVDDPPTWFCAITYFAWDYPHQIQ